ncbi:Cytochrome c [Roseovarius sp. THAF9]|uniref:di-heme-cytochrome C peroxidase n=1 Tax=Roseovarius sp. THAF9 TaxID=2587847 RepID=UPI0012691839|nr:di-heme-cytochrome C peroxidase [Roseovarius sp. THAF9]QFT93927.1 Cytochrome c [Roseovarius sp. THAF9]
MKKCLKFLHFSAAFVFSAAALPSSAQPLSEVSTACTGGDLTCLDQGWSEEQRQWWYTVSQGSRLIPLSWALALKTADGTSAMYGPANLARLGYLPNPASVANPEGLPVGFVVDHDPRRTADLMCDTFPETCRSRTMREPWIGLNCSACHTMEITSNGTRFRVDGGPALADFDALVNGTEDALRATVADAARFQSFATAISGGQADAETLSSLRDQLNEQLDWMAALRAINHGEVIAGPARLDAQGHILTKVSMINGAASPADDFASDAPASYPFIWNTHQQTLLQWNGIAPSILKLPLFGRTTDFGALVRNVSEVIGVFAHIEANRGYAGLGYDSSTRLTEMVGLERLLSRLQSPVWPEDILGAIDPVLEAEGHVLFEANCRRCHAHLEPDDLRTPAGDQMTNLLESGTDIFLACNTYLRTTASGNMEGQRTLGFFGDKIDEVDATRKMLINASVGSIIGKADELVSALFSDIEPERGTIIMDTPAGEVLPGVVDPVKKERARQCLTASDPLLAYKARPLNGIWANGSVPTLYDLLLPARARNFAAAESDGSGPFRPETFGVGSREFDPVNVGFTSGGAPWTFRVRDDDGNIIPGNSNAGHDYGNAAFTDSERRAIVEYLKGL